MAYLDYNGLTEFKTKADAAYASAAEVSEQLNEKYTKYQATLEEGLSLDMFSICPTQYSIVQYDDTDALQHSTLAGTGITYLRSKLKSSYDDIKFKICSSRAFAATPSLYFAFAVNNDASIGLNINATSGNISKYSDTAISVLTGITRNSNCRSLVVGDEVHCVKKGTEIALYLVDNGIDVPIFAGEWVDVLETYPNAGFSAEDICFGIVTTNSARNEPLINDFSYMSESGDHFMPYDEVDERLTALENGYTAPSTVDLFLFMGQSNMAGRGNSSQAPEVIDGAGFEFRAISDPTKLYKIAEPFGIDENVSGAIYDYLGEYKAKSGGLVASFVNAYYGTAKKTIVGVSASEGGTRIQTWQPNTARYNDALSRLNAAIAWLTGNGYTIRHKYILWCQGESDGDDGLSKADYISAFTTMANAWFANGIETIFVIKIGNYNGTGAQDYNTIMTAQNEICQTMENVVMASTDFASMKDRDLMKDDFHYTQAAYNEVGEYAGINTALYVTTHKEPTMYDTQNDSLYFTKKN